MKTVFGFAIFFALATAAAGQNQGQQLSAKAVLSSDSAYVGEAIQLNIVVSGTTQAEQPNLDALTQAFSVTPAGGGPQTRMSMGFRNGQSYRHEEKSYHFVYQLVPKQAGTITIPSIEVRAAGQTLRTQPVQMIARPPGETASFKLRGQLSKQRVYVGEPLILDLFFYYQAEIRDHRVSIPDNPNFHIHDLGEPGGNQVAQLDGQDYQAYHLRKVALIPKRPGNLQLDSATMAFNGVSGYETVRDFFGRPVKRALLKKFVIPSNQLNLQVLDVPAQGRPANFAGHIGAYRIDASATPTTVNVGDPITLTIAISGPDFLQHVGLPALNNQANLARDFRVPDEMSSGEIQGRAKVFTQTIRASNSQVRQIPAIELPYFDTQTGTYQIARSNPIPIAVQATRVVTAADAEGADPAAPKNAEIESWTSGIAHNYEGSDALRDQVGGARQLLKSPAFLGTLAAPPLGFFAILIALWISRRRAADPEGARERKALKTLNEKLDSATESDDVLEAFKAYLGGKLRLPSGALTFNDVREPLEAKNLSEEAIAEVKSIFDACEASSYSGGASSEDVAELAERSRAIASKLEAALTKKRSRTGLGKTAALVAALLVSIPGVGRAALSDREVSQLFKEGNELFRQANGVSETNPGQAEQLYRASVLRFERIVREGGVRNGQLFYNIGNAYFQAGDIGRAILNYLRAAELTPNDSNLKQNLAYARSKRADPIEEESGGGFLETVFFWHHDFPASLRAWIFGIAFVSIWAAAGVRLFRKQSYLSWIIGVSTVIAAAFLASLVLEARASNRSNPGVIISSEVIARKGDSENYEPSFSKPLHAGTEFDLLERRANWLRVRLADERECWLPAQAVGLVRRQPDQGRRS